MTEPVSIEEAPVGFREQSRNTAAAWTRGWPDNDVEFAELVETFQHQLVRFAFRRLGRLQDAEDVVQDVFVRAYTQMGCPRRVTHVGAYLYRMVTNACTDRLRKRKRATLSLDVLRADGPPSEGKTVAEEASALEELRRIDAVLRRLPKRQAEVVWLRVYNELSFSDIAAVVGCSVPTAKSRFRYGLGKLRRLVKDWEVTP